jgi:hypothetical protein
MDIKKFLLAAALFTAVAQIVHTIGAVLSMGYYTDPAYFSVWSKVMMPAAGPPPAGFYLISIGFGFLTALIFVYMFDILKKSVPGKDYLRKGLSYGALLFLLATVPSSFSMLLLINLPFGLVASWAVEELVIMLAGGILMAKITE